MLLKRFFLIFLCCWPAFVVLSAEQKTIQTEKGVSIDAALSSALVNNLDVHLSAKSLLSQKNILKMAKADFDQKVTTTISQSRTYNPLSESSKPFYRGGKRVADSSEYNINYERLLKSGTSLSHSINFDKTVDNAYSPEDSPNRTRVSVGATFPINRGNKRDIVTAHLDAIDLEIKSAQHYHIFTMSNVMSSTARAFWEYKGAIAQLEVYQDSVERARKLLEDTKILVEAHEVPKVELDALEAHLSEKIAVAINAQQAIVAYRQQLALAMGLSSDKITDISYPTCDFPKVDKQQLELLSSPKFVQIALNNREDLTAYYLLKLAAEKKHKQAKDNLKPEINFHVDAGYSGYVDGSGLGSRINSLHRNQSGLDVAGWVSYEWPGRNQSSRAQHESALIEIQKAELEIKKLSREIRSSVLVALSDAATSIRRLMEIERSLKLYRKAVESEKNKHTLGMATLLDVVQIEDRLTDSYIQRIYAQQAYAIAIAQLRHELGILGEFDRGTIYITKNDLFSLPDPKLFLSEKEDDQT